MVYARIGRIAVLHSVCALNGKYNEISIGFGKSRKLGCRTISPIEGNELQCNTPKQNPPFIIQIIMLALDKNHPLWLRLLHPPIIPLAF